MTGQGNLASAEVENQWQLLAIQGLRNGANVYTSPRALRHLLDGNLLGSECCSHTGNKQLSHELFIITSQSSDSFSDNSAGSFMSCVCRNCRSHFHIESVSDTHDDSLHMFVPVEGKAPGSPLLVCIVDGCACRIETTLVPPVINNGDAELLVEKSQLQKRNGSAKTALIMLKRIVNDALDREDQEATINKTRPVFSDSLGGDADNVLTSLGLKDKGTTWIVPGLAPSTGRTQVETQRAQWEKALAELRFLDEDDIHLPHAWDALQQVFRGKYASVKAPAAIDEDSVRLLGCLPDFAPSVFVWATKQLCDKHPTKASDYLHAAKQCSLERDENSASDMAIFESARPEFGLPNGSSSDAADQDPNSMSVEQACKFLDVEHHYSADIIEGFVNNLAQDYTVDREKAYNALNTLAEFKLEKNPEDASRLKDMAQIFTKSATALMNMTTTTTDKTAPPGLRNIGNTCYLNSILQYFYNVKPIRNLVLNYDQYKLDLDDASVKARRTGGASGDGTAVNLDLAIVARQFMEELRSLFIHLQLTEEIAASPSQKLANVALKSGDRLLAELNQNEPPPLPARPSPAIPPTSSQYANTVIDGKELASDTTETVSCVSSETAIDKDEAMAEPSVEVGLDIPEAIKADASQDSKNDASNGTTLDDKMRSIARCLEQSDRKGTTQQDVGEIIIYIFDHFMRAIRPEGEIPDRPDLQADIITRTFFSMVVDYTLPFDDTGTQGEKRKLVVPEHWIGAFPPTKRGEKRTIHDALDQTFTLGFTNNNTLAKYSAIRSLPPILHIFIQRTQLEKNRNPVVIEDVLYMDRYMETETGSLLDQNRQKLWAYKVDSGLLAAINENDVEEVAKTEVKSDPDSEIILTGWDDDNGGEEKVNGVSLDTSILEGFAPVPGPKVPYLKRPASLMTDPLTKPQSVKRRCIGLSTHSFSELQLPHPVSALELETDGATKAGEETLEQRRQKAMKYFDELTNEKYRLHAVICHGGGVTAGHYWVWIRDFKKNVWLKYNDETVTEDARDPQDVLDQLSDSGDPYYLAYVRDEMKDDLVDVPQRAPKDSDTNGVDTNGTDVEMMTIDGIAADDGHIDKALP